jgi:UDP-N-acetylmuramoyl-tripeptide--D-alanyl-D-alanine ligase
VDQPELVSKPETNFKPNCLEKLSLQTIADFSGGILRHGGPAALVGAIGADSRTLAPGELFLALRGEKFDGHAYLLDIATRGAIGAIVARDYKVPENLPPDFALIETEDTLLAYQQIAARYRRTLPMKVIGITGSNGKTSTKDFTAAVLGRKFRVLKTEGNFNNHIGVPRMLLRASRADEIAVLEMGMNHPGEIAPLAAMAAPQAAIITNIGTAHIEFMKTREAIALEKGALAEAIGADGFVILPAADDFSKAIAARTRARVVTVGLDAGDIRAENLSQDLDGSRFDLVADGERLSAALPVPSRHMVVNALLAVAAGRVCGLSLAECAAGLADVQLTKGRLERKILRSGLQVLDDSYNANPDSMAAALETLAHIPTQGRRIAVLGKMGELGEASESGHRRVGEVAARVGIDQLIGVGPEAAIITRSARDAGLKDSSVVASVEQAAGLLATQARPGDLILIKGSRSAGMERVITVLDQLPMEAPESPAAARP